MSDPGNRSFCGNCFGTNPNLEATNVIFNADNNEVQIIDAISYIYGITSEDLLLLLNESKIMENIPENEEIENWFHLCQPCSWFLSLNYKTHKRFEGLSHPSSLIHKISSSFRRRQENENSFDRKECNSEEVSSDIDFPQEDEFVAEPFNFEDQYNERDDIEQKYDISEPSISEEESPISKAEHDTIKSSLNLRQVSVKLERLPDEYLQKYIKTVSPEMKKGNIKFRKNIKRSHYGKYSDETCEICGKKFRHKYLKIHMAVVHGDLSAKRKWRGFCQICKRIVGYLKRHMEVRHSEKRESYKCGICTKEYLVKRLYDEHILTHSPSFTPYLCGQCGKSYQTKTALMVHEKTHTDKFVCHICQKICPSPRGLINHVNTHSTEKNFVCHECGNKYKSESRLRRHFRIHKEIAEKGEYSVKCEECNKFFKHSFSLYKHNAAKHRADLKKDHKCAFCGKVFWSQQSWKLHENRHKRNPDYQLPRTKALMAKRRNKEIQVEPSLIQNSNDKQNSQMITKKTNPNKFVCHICQEKCFSSRGLRNHVDTAHSPTENNFVCRQCGKKCQSESKLRQHLTIHKEIAEKGEYSAKCEKCNKSFRHSRSLLKHMSTYHRPDLLKKVYKCSFCGKHLVSQYNLQVHEKLHQTNPDFQPRKGKTSAKVETDFESQQMHESKSNDKQNPCENNCQTNTSVVVVQGKTRVALSCHICQEICISTTSLRNHVDTAHSPTENNFICLQCGKKYNSEAVLRQHIKIHKEIAEKGEYSAKCQQCSRTFKNSRSLYTHTAIYH